MKDHTQRAREATVRRCAYVTTTLRPLRDHLRDLAVTPDVLVPETEREGYRTVLNGLARLASTISPEAGFRELGLLADYEQARHALRILDLAHGPLAAEPKCDRPHLEGATS